VADEIPAIADNPKAALESFITELETYYYPWYDRATTHNYWAWVVAQAVSVLSGFVAALLAALASEELLRYWNVTRALLIALPLIGALASSFLVQSRIAEMEALREKGRETIQRLANEARANFAAASSPEQYTTIHRTLVSEVSILEQEQSRGFQRIIPKALAFRSSAPRTR
jgi:hypothetical protein